MSKIFKTAKRAVSGLVKGIKKIFHKITESKLGRVVLIAATIYLGGAALGAWSVPSAVPYASSINGAWTAAGSQAAQAAAGQVAATGTTSALGGGGAFANMPAGIETLTVTGTPTAGVTAGQVAGGVAGAATGNAVADTVTTRPTQLPADTKPLTAPGPVNSNEGILERLLSGAKGKLGDAVGWAGDHPYATAMGLNAAASMLSPDQMDLQQQEQEYEDKQRERLEGNLNVGGIRLSAQPNRTEARTMAGEPLYANGFLNTAMTPRRTA